MAEPTLADREPIATGSLKTPQKIANDSQPVSSQQLPLLTPKEVSARLKLSRQQVYNLLLANELEGIRFRHGWRVEEDSLARYIDANRLKKVG